MAQWVKNPPVMQGPQETRVPSLDQEDHLEEEMTTHPSILAWEIPWAEGAGDYKEPDKTEHSTASGQAGGNFPHVVLLSLFASAGCVSSQGNVIVGRDTRNLGHWMRETPHLIPSQARLT